MQKIDLIREIVVKKKAEEEKLNLKLEELKGKKKKKLTEEMATYFSGILCDPDGDAYIEVSDNYIYFKMQHEDYKYPKEILSLSLRGENWSDAERSRIETGFYSTTENSIFELNRMVVIGKVGQILLDFSDDILACWNSVVNDFKEDIDKARKALWAKEAEIREHEKEITELKNAELSKKLESEGIKFKVDEENLYRLPQLDVRFDWTVKNIRSMRILDKTKSGKSADIEIGTIHKTYNSDKGEYELVFRNNKYERVRMDKIEYVVYWNKDKIVSS